MKLLHASANRDLTNAIATALDVPVTKIELKPFADTETFVSIEENVRGEDCFIVQSTSAPANEHVMELLICIDALKRASAARITAVIPYFGYARQDRKTQGRTPITAKLIANLIYHAGADRVLTMELHAGQIQGFFDMPTDNLFADRLIAEHVQRVYPNDDLIVVSPDVGGVVRARQLAGRLETAIAIVDKRRPKPGEAEVMNVVGEVTGKHCLIYDDIVDSGGTLVNAAARLKKDGAVKVSAICVHGVLSRDAANRIQDSELDELTITDSIEKDRQIFSKKSKIKQLPVSGLVGEAIRRIANNESLSKLFD